MAGSGCNAYQIRKIYAIGGALGMVKRNEEDDLLHELVESMTGKKSIKALTYSEACKVIGELEGRQGTPPPRKSGKPLRKTAPGLYIQSVGINKKASRIAGINSERIIFLCYVVCGLCAGIAGIVASSRISSADSNNIGLNFELDAILAVALGGNSLGGGKFRLAGSIIGAYTIQAITTTLYALGISTEQAPVYKAVIVIIIVAIQAPPFKAFMKKMSVRRQLAKGGAA